MKTLQRLSRSGPAAQVLVLAGLATAAAGVWVLTEVGWGLIAAGVAAVLGGLLAIDVDS